MDTLKKHITKYLDSISTMQLATSQNNTPWCCNVYFTFDENLNIFFISRPTRNHSEHIRENPKVAVCFCKEHEKPFEMPNSGIQANGNCKEINHENAKFSEYKKLYLNRLPHSNKLFESHDVYKIKLENIILFDEINYPDKPWETLKLN